MKKTEKSFFRVFWQISISLKFAVMVMLGLTAALITATFMESAYDTPTAQYWVYQTWYFYGILGLLFWLILAVALSRLPWQKKHLPFLCAHLGILLLLYGSWLTFQFGIDGSLQVTEGRTESTIEMNEPLLLVSGKDFVRQTKVPWIPPNATFRPIALPEFGIRVSQFISRAEPQVNFLPSTELREIAAPAIRIKLAGGSTAPPFMRMGTEAWLWAGDRNWSSNQLGAATLTLLPKAIDEKREEIAFATKGPEAILRLSDVKRGTETHGRLTVAIQTSDGKRSEQRFDYTDPKELLGKVIHTGWKFDAQITVLDWVPRAISDVSYVPSRVQFGSSVSSSAILLESAAAPGTSAPPAKIWLGLGERATLDAVVDGKSERLTLGYFPRRIVLPFGIALDRFEIDRYQGTANPSEFSSVVTVKAGTNDGALPPGEAPPAGHRISMNEPMKYGGFTFYQASYVSEQPRPKTSIFSVNQDPGRWLKYLGSLLLVFGSIWLFAVKYVRKKG